MAGDVVIKGSSDGYVYVLTNRSMPGVVKVGRTQRAVSKRAGELWQTGVPTPFDVAFSVRTPDCQRVEAEVHAALAMYRVDEAREFFLVDAEHAAEKVQEIAQEVFEDWLEVYAPGTVTVPAEAMVDPSAIYALAHYANAEAQDVALALVGAEYADLAQVIDSWLNKKRRAA